MCFRISYVGEFNSGIHVLTTICVAFCGQKLRTYFSIFGRFVWNRHSHLLHIMWYFNADIGTFVPSNLNTIKATFLFLYPFSGWIFQVIGKIRDIDFITNNRCLSRSVTPKAHQLNSQQHFYYIAKKSNLFSEICDFIASGAIQRVCIFVNHTLFCTIISYILNWIQRIWTFKATINFAYFLWLSEINWINVDPQNFMEKRVSFVNDLQICTLPCIVSTFDSYWNSVIASIILRMNNSLALWMWILLLRIHLIRLRLFDISLGCGALCCTRTVFEEDWFHSRKRYFFFSHWIHMSVSIWYLDSH